MSRVLAYGAFDFLHPADLHYLRRSEDSGSSLWIAVTPDSMRDRPSIQPEETRLELVDTLECVDTAILADVSRPWTLERVKPDVVTYRESDVDPSVDESTLAAIRSANPDLELVGITAYEPADYELTSVADLWARGKKHR